ncbi:hypothetical protein EYF80_041446 [Liparis tanakae]|uniref:Uncharacterized protein n=1 Tax=Liparis tanakae TaxID=230148 RepID=A0A4Z2G487_9TELE|nr:hypothetical protein EYF80_041446 [Liparis tanakae]
MGEHLNPLPFAAIIAARRELQIPNFTHTLITRVPFLHGKSPGVNGMTLSQSAGMMLMAIHNTAEYCRCDLKVASRRRSSSHASSCGQELLLAAPRGDNTVTVTTLREADAVLTGRNQQRCGFESNSLQWEGSDLNVETSGTYSSEKRRITRNRLVEDLRGQTEKKSAAGIVQGAVSGPRALVWGPLHMEIPKRVNTGP